MDAAETGEGRSLEISFHGRVIEHLGIEMYHSPVAAIAELVSNAWDAEASEVRITLPNTLADDSVIVITDDGDGMTFAECQERFLRVGYNRRKVDGAAKTRSGRPVMGRKGIGKFAGFGIARAVKIASVSRSTGEKTVFRLDVEKLLGESDGSDTYVDNTPMEVDVIEYLEPDEGRKANHGTTITLERLTLKQTPSEVVFAKSMARRFLLLERAEGFTVRINDSKNPPEAEKALIEFDFPTDYGTEQVPDGLTMDAGWGIETVAGHEIRWRFYFYKDPIGDEELAGVSVFSHGKLAQRPFHFSLSGGLGGQQALPYLSGMVQADFIDDQTTDLISTERQRINWEHESAVPLLEWGQARLKSLLRLWQSRRSESKVKAMEDRVATFSGRLDKLERHERTIVRRALIAIARITSISTENFDQLAHAILTAWEGGRLKDLIHDMASADDMDANALVQLLADNKVMTALHTAEHVKAQLNLVLSLQERIQNKQLENAVRDYIANNPWLISPKWETFKVETGVNNLIREAIDETAISTHDDWVARVDLCLSSGSHLLILEFMRPGLSADWDHVDRFERYVSVLREKVAANASRFDRVTGVLVADRLEKRSGFAAKLTRLRSDDMDAMDWESLLATAKAQWLAYFDILEDRVPGDERMRALAEASRSIANAGPSADGAGESRTEEAADVEGSSASGRTVTASPDATPAE